MKLLTIVLPTLLAAGVLSKAIPQPNPDIVIETIIRDDETPSHGAAHGVQWHTSPSIKDQQAGVGSLKTLMLSFMTKNDAQLECIPQGQLCETTEECCPGHPCARVGSGPFNFKICK
ncbi:MAG: hypothetical protein L6R40_001386 [Gallowayella cf. fulva]|nr:MAG: hypothetical protein L6R40_001386 [Xanthomendoza cf. fulva]